MSGGAGSGAPRAGVAAAHRLAARAGAAMLRADGNAADAAVAAAAVMAVTSPHMCGLGGDLFALVSDPAGGPPAALNASGRAGAGADAARLRAEGHTRMPFRDDVRAVTVPGCVDGLLTLHGRFGGLALDRVLAPAIDLARDGFPVSATLAAAAPVLGPELRAIAFATDGRPLRHGEPLRRPALAGTLQAIVADGRAGFYEGVFGDELRTLGDGLFAADDLRRPLADWTAPLSTAALDHQIWTIAPNSQGYLALAGAWIADAVGLPADPGDPAWALTLVEAAARSARDRLTVLHEHADGAALLHPDRLRPHADAILAAAPAGAGGDAGAHDAARDTTYLCAVDAQGRGVSLILSNCAGFGAHLGLPRSGVLLHNRGIGFSLVPGHPAEYGPGRRPPHTLSPLAVTRRDGSLRAVLGTMGGDAQPQIGLQLLARLLRAGEGPGIAVPAPRFVLTREPTNGFDTWETAAPPLVMLEHGVPEGWAAALRARGHGVRRAQPGDRGFGHAQMIAVEPAGAVAGAADLRARDGAFTPAG